MLHATGRQTNKTQIISVTQMINKGSFYVSTNARTVELSNSNQWSIRSKALLASRNVTYTVVPFVW